MQNPNMMTHLDRAGQLLLEAQELLKYRPHLQESIELVIESIDREIDYETEADKYRRED